MSNLKQYNIINFLSIKMIVVHIKLSVLFMILITNCNVSCASVNIIQEHDVYSKLSMTKNVNKQPSPNSTKKDSCITQKYMSVKSNKAIVRTGPSVSHKKIWTFVSAKEPVEILESFELWKKIRDVDKQEGWIHQNLLSKNNTCVIVNKNTNAIKNQKNSTTPFVIMTSAASGSSRTIAHLYPNVRCDVLECKNFESKYSNENYQKVCHLRCNGTKGWVSHDNLWGI